MTCLLRTGQLGAVARGQDHFDTEETGPRTLIRLIFNALSTRRYFCGCLGSILSSVARSNGVSFSNHRRTIQQPLMIGNFGAFFPVFPVSLMHFVFVPHRSPASISIQHGQIIGFDPGRIFLLHIDSRAST